MTVVAKYLTTNFPVRSRSIGTGLYKVLPGLCCRLVSPVLLRGLLTWLRGNAVGGNAVWPVRHGWMYAALLAVSGFVLAIIHHQLFWCRLPGLDCPSYPLLLAVQ